MKSIEDDIEGIDERSEKPLLNEEEGGGVWNLSYLVGTINSDIKTKFERLIFRVSRNTC